MSSTKVVKIFVFVPIFLVLTLIVLADTPQSEPILPSFFYGSATVNGRAVPIDSYVTAKIEGELRGSIKLTTVGQYGTASSDWKLGVIGDRNDVGATIEFFVKLPGKEEIKSSQTAVWRPGERSELNLQFTGAEIDSAAPTPTPTPTPTPVPSGGAIVTQTANGETFTYLTIDADSQLSMSLSNDVIPITQLQIVVKNPINGSTAFEFESLTAAPVTRPANLYRYVKIESGVSDTNIKTAVLRFRIPMTWLEQNGKDPEKVKLQRYTGNRWTILTTAYEGEDDDYAYYRAGTPGFSYFAITAERTATTTTPTSTTSTTTTSSTTQLQGEQGNQPGDEIDANAQATPTPAPTTGERRNLRELLGTDDEPSDEGDAGDAEQITGAAIGAGTKSANSLLGLAIIGLFAIIGIIIHLVITRGPYRKR